MTCDDCRAPIEPGEQWARDELTHCACCSASIFGDEQLWRLATQRPYGVLLPLEAVRDLTGKG